MMIFRLIAGPPKRIQPLLSWGIPSCLCKQVSEVMYQQTAPVVHRHLLHIPYTSLYGWRNRGRAYSHWNLGFKRSWLRFVSCGIGLVGELNRNLRDGRELLTILYYRKIHFVVSVRTQNAGTIFVRYEVSREIQDRFRFLGSESWLLGPLICT